MGAQLGLVVYPHGHDLVQRLRASSAGQVWLRKSRLAAGLSPGNELADKLLVIDFQRDFHGFYLLYLAQGTERHIREMTT